MKSFVRLGLVALLCMALVGCAGFFLGVAFADAKYKQEEHARWLANQCQAITAKGIMVTQSPGIPILHDEGNIIAFESAIWRVQFASEGFPQVERNVSGLSGTLAITERSVVLAASLDASGVRIPYELIANVDVEKNSRTGLPHAVIVESFCGRFDVFTFFSQQEPNKRDPEVIKTAAAQLKARLATFHATSGTASKDQSR
jgi:hypothetical protein